MKISLFSFFAGIGILDLAFEKNAYNIVFVNEFNRLFLDAYKYAHNQIYHKEPLYGYSNRSAEYYVKGYGKRKLEQLIATERRNGCLIGFIGGPPCPDFSIAGKNAGAKGENGRLTTVYFDIICRCRPDFFLFENVKGLVKTEKHRIFYQEMKSKLRDNNYVVDDTIANALEYGVPQFRERVFLIGINKNLYADYTETLSFNWKENAIFNVDDILKRNWPKPRAFAVNSLCKPPSHAIPRKLTVEYWFNRNNVTQHPNGNDIFAVKKGQNKISTIQEGDTSGKSFKRLHRWKYSPTAAYGNNEVHLHPYQERRLSVSEALAIQSLPQEFVVLPTLTLSTKFKMIGNGVPFLMASAIARTLKETLKDVKRSHIIVLTRVLEEISKYKQEESNETNLN